MMDEFLRLMTYPFLACLLLAGIHVYLGIHVISRKVIFVDLALAQIAAFGAVYGVLLGYNLHENPWTIKLFSLLFALIGATVFSLTRMRRERIPQEAIIGITYAVTLAGTILANAHLPHGAQEVQALLSGSILWVTKEIILSTALVYAAVAAILAIFHRNFMRISLDPQLAMEEGLRLRWWDFSFYALFGFVVTSSVAIGGVLLVFSFLVIPAAIAVLFANRIWPRLAIGWIVGTIVSFFGVTVSYRQDLPSGPTIVVSLGAFLALAAVARLVIRSPNRPKTIGKLAGVLAALLIFVSGTLLLRKEEGHDFEEMLRCPDKTERLLALQSAARDETLWLAANPFVETLLVDPEAEVRRAVLELIEQYHASDFLESAHESLFDPDRSVRESGLHCVANLHDPISIEPLLEAMNDEEDERLRIELGHVVLELGDNRAFPGLLEIADRSSAIHVRREAYEHLLTHFPEDLPPFRPDVDPDSNDDQIARIQAWWSRVGCHLRWNETTHRFDRPE